MWSIGTHDEKINKQNKKQMMSCAGELFKRRALIPSKNLPWKYKSLQRKLAEKIKEKEWKEGQIIIEWKVNL